MTDKINSNILSIPITKKFKLKKLKTKEEFLTFLFKKVRENFFRKQDQ